MFIYHIYTCKTNKQTEYVFCAFHHLYISTHPVCIHVNVIYLEQCVISFLSPPLLLFSFTHIHLLFC
eukprot:UN05452